MLLRNPPCSGGGCYIRPLFSCHCNTASVQQGSGECAVPFRHEQKGGALPSFGGRDWGGRRLLQRHERPLRDSQAVRQSREGAVAETAQRREQRWQQNMDPLVGFALAHAQQPPHLNGVGLQVSEQEEQPIFRRCQRAGPVDGEAVRGFPSRRHAAIWSWNSKGVTSNSSRVKLVRLRNSAGRACTSANRTPLMDRASCQGTVLS